MRTKLNGINGHSKHRASSVSLKLTLPPARQATPTTHTASGGGDFAASPAILRTPSGMAEFLRLDWFLENIVAGPALDVFAKLKEQYGGGADA